MNWKIVNIDASDIQSQYGTGVLTSKLLKASSLSSEQMEELLRGEERLFTSHAECVIRACERILRAKQNNEKVMIAGDYDADGICSTAIMKKTLDMLEIVNGYYIPDRFKEGYGLSAETVTAAYQKGYTLIITVDNGVKAHQALLKAKEYGIDVIVTDHHTIEEEIEAPIVVHPQYMEEDFAYLSGAGVALEISRNLIGEADDERVTLCAVALIGDVMPLWRETRKIVKCGLQLLRRGIPRSLSTLVYPATSAEEIDVAFSIVPKLNSVGRLNDRSNVNTLVQYLLCKDQNAIQSYSNALNNVNRKRKQLSEKMTVIAKEKMNEDKLPVIYDSSFHEGICGLVAGKIANEYHRPVVVMAENGEVYKGSGRSVPGFNMFDFFSDFEEKQSFGGHPAAIGISIKKEDMSLFLEKVQKKMETNPFTYEEPEKTAIVIDPNCIDFDSIADLSCLSPYPKDMIEPNFVVENPIVLCKKETTGTVRYTIDCGHCKLDAVVYKNRGLYCPDILLRVIGTLKINRFRGIVSLQMIVEDLM